jgi:hypothetical protein
MNAVVRLHLDGHGDGHGHGKRQREGLSVVRLGRGLVGWGNGNGFSNPMRGERSLVNE